VSDRRMRERKKKEKNGQPVGWEAGWKADEYRNNDASNWVIDQSLSFSIS
jgi:hypothetical protein